SVTLYAVSCESGVRWLRCSSVIGVGYRLDARLAPLSRLPLTPRRQQRAGARSLLTARCHERCAISPPVASATEGETHEALGGLVRGPGRGRGAPARLLR